MKPSKNIVKSANRKKENKKKENNSENLQDPLYSIMKGGKKEKAGDGYKQELVNHPFCLPWGCYAIP